jgi:hypothetical protein
MNESHEPRASDFLDRMVGKAVGAADALKPRVSGMYEPLATSNPEDPWTIAGDETDPESLEVEGADETPRRISPPSRARVARPNGRPPVEAVAEAERPKVTRGDGAAHARVHEIQSFESDTAPASHAVTGVRAPEVVERPSHASATTSNGSAVIAAPESMRIANDAPGRNDRTPAAAPEGVLVAPAAEASWADPHRPSQSPFQPLADRRRDQIQARAPETTVNVTIGRVEVRAVQPRAGDRPGPRGQKSLPLSLDEYLKQSGGAR